MLSVRLGGIGVMEACKEATPTVGRGPNQRSSGVGWQESGRRQSRGVCLALGALGNNFLVPGLRDLQTH